MRRFSWAASILLVVVFWQSCAPTRSHPAGGPPARGRRFDSGSSSARRRDDLLVGSDFLDMYIGSPARSRRYPLDGRRNPPDVRVDRMSGLIRSRDRAENSDDYQRGVRRVAQTPRDDDARAEKTINEAMESDKLFGKRTAPRASAATSSTSYPESSTDEDITATSTDRLSVSDVSTNSGVPVNHFHVPVLPKFSVSSSVQKITSKHRQNVRHFVYQSTQNPTTFSDAFPSTSQDLITEEMTTDAKTSSSLDFQSTSSDISPHDVTTTTSLPELDSTEALEDWSTKSDASTLGAPRNSDETQTAETPESVETETPTQVVSVRVSSSVAQTPRSFRTKQIEVHNSNPTEPPAEVEQNAVLELEEAAGSLVVEEQPPATSIQRHDFSVEEASPSEVTAGPHPVTASDPQVSPVSYQTSVTTATSGSRFQFFSKPPSYRRGLSYLRRTSTDASIPVTANPRRHIPLHAIPRAYIPRSSTSSPLTSGREPVSVAESIQRSVIADQDQDVDDSKDRVEGARGIKSFQARDSVGKRYGQQEKVYEQPEKVYGEPAKVYGEPSKVYGEPAKVYGEPAKVYGEPAKVYGEPAKVYGEPAKVYGEPAKTYGEPAKTYGEPAKIYGEPSKIYGEPAKVYGEPAKVYGEPSKSYAEPEQNYEVDEAVSVNTNGRAHGVQSTPPTPSDAGMKVFDTRQQDPNHKFGYVVEGRDYRKYRVEERTSDGFIVGEYGVVSHDGGSLRGVRYTADGTINPRLIYDTLLKFLSL